MEVDAMVRLVSRLNQCLLVEEACGIVDDESHIVSTCHYPVYFPHEIYVFPAPSRDVHYPAHFSPTIVPENKTKSNL